MGRLRGQLVEEWGRYEGGEAGGPVARCFTVSAMYLPWCSLQSSSRVWGFGCAFAVDAAMGPFRRETLIQDRLKTAAISKYVSTYRDELLRELPDEAKVNKNTKRSELLRLGRRRFSQLPKSDQDQYFKDAGRKDIVESENVAVRSSPGNSGVAPLRTVRGPPSPPRGPPGGSPPRASLKRSSAFPSEGVVKNDEVRLALAASLGVLQKLFGDADGLAALATSHRMAAGMHGFKGPVRVKAAAILSLAVKMELTVENASIRRLWSSVAGERSIEQVKAMERKLFECFSLEGVEGTYAQERLSMLIEDLD